MSLEDAVYRMTGKTALMHDLHDRGFLAAGKAADITIFDPDTIGPMPREPMYEFPGGEMHVKQGAVGMDYVISTVRSCWTMASTPAPFRGRP